jgi:nucleoid DNA-binding protein
MPADPVAHVLGESLVKLLEIPWHDEPVVPNIVRISNRERISFQRFFHREAGKVLGYRSIRTHRDISFEKDVNRMRASLRGRGELAARVQQALALPTKKEAEMVVDAVVTALEATLLHNLETNGFTLKLGSFGKFSVRHKAGILRRIPFTGETILTKDRRKVRFVSLGSLRQRERVD